MIADMPEWGLLKGDRLEPIPTMIDIGGFDGINMFPFSVCFWRRSLETVCRRRNPLFDERIGITIENVIAVDSLHTNAQGVYV